MNIARVFPRITKATPNDPLAFFDSPGMFVQEIDEVHISVSFTWDIKMAEWLALQWESIAPVKIGGPAFNQPSGEFVPGRYLKKGYTITSRGCPNRCWFCSVWKREPELKELPINEGVNILDDNLLACSEKHIAAVFEMLKNQQGRVEFTGGLEAKKLKPWHVQSLIELKPYQMFFALDTPDDEEPLREASKLLLEAGFRRNQMRCYVLIGWPQDTFNSAESRLKLTWQLGFLPMAMLWRDYSGNRDNQWMKFQRTWSRPAAIKAIMDN